jgi:hypothetical protein
MNRYRGEVPAIDLWIFRLVYPDTSTAVYTWANVHTALLSKFTHIFTVLTVRFKSNPGRHSKSSGFDVAEDRI